MSNELFGEVVKTISLDFAQKTSPVTVFAKQGDNRTRIIHIQPLMNGVPMNIDTSFQYVAKFAAKKPDGHYVYNDSAKINEDGTITVTLTDQTLAAHGNATCCVMLETQSGDVLTSQNFTLIIEFSAGAYKNLASSDEIMGLDDKLSQVQELIDKLNAEIKVLPPINPEDKDKVLTANEDGTASWKTPAGGNGGNANFIFANSKEELPDPSTVPENSVGLVPSEGGGSGVTSWNDLTDKPFGEEVVKTNVINWDGVDGTVFADAFHRVSDATPTAEQLVGCSIVVNEGDGDATVTVTEEMIMPMNEDLVLVVATEMSFVMVAYKDNTEFEENEEIVIIPKKGVYFPETVKSVTLTSEVETTVVKKIEDKYVSEKLPHITDANDGDLLRARNGKWVAEPFGRTEWTISVYQIQLTQKAGIESISLDYSYWKKAGDPNPSFLDLSLYGTFIRGTYRKDNEINTIMCSHLSPQGTDFGGFDLYMSSQSESGGNTYLQYHAGTSLNYECQIVLKSFRSMFKATPIEEG